MSIDGKFGVEVARLMIAWYSCEVQVSSLELELKLDIRIKILVFSASLTVLTVGILSLEFKIYHVCPLSTLYSIILFGGIVLSSILITGWGFPSYSSLYVVIVGVRLIANFQLSFVK